MQDCREELLRYMETVEDVRKRKNLTIRSIAEALDVNEFCMYNTVRIAKEGNGMVMLRSLIPYIRYVFSYGEDVRDDAPLYLAVNNRGITTNAMTIEEMIKTRKQRFKAEEFSELIFLKYTGSLYKLEKRWLLDNLAATYGRLQDYATLLRVDAVIF